MTIAARNALDTERASEPREPSAEVLELARRVVQHFGHRCPPHFGHSCEDTDREEQLEVAAWIDSLLSSEREKREQAEQKAKNVEDILEDILGRYPYNHCRPSNTCFDDCAEAWREDAEEWLKHHRESRGAPKQKCASCGSECLPMQLLEDKCRYCRLRDRLET